MTAYIRKFALVIILIRAGLEMDPAAFKKVWLTIIKLGLVPWTAECILCAVLTHFFFGMEWLWAFALGSIIAAVSPAVIVPCLFRLRTKGYGVAKVTFLINYTMNLKFLSCIFNCFTFCFYFSKKGAEKLILTLFFFFKGIPTLIVAISGIDDAASVAIFGILASIIFGTGGIAYQVSQAPVCIFGGLLFGVFWGILMKFIPEKGDAYVIPIRTLMLFAGGVLAVFGSEHVGFEGAGPLGVVFAAFVG